MPRRTKKNPVHRWIKTDDGKNLAYRDAHWDVRISIVEADNLGAVCLDPHHCVVTRAAERTLRGLFHTEDVWGSTGAAVTTIRIKDDIFRWLIPQNERVLIRQFDNGSLFPVGFTILLKAPQAPTERLGGSKKHRGAGTNNGTRPGIASGAAKSLAHPERMPSRHVCAPMSELATRLSTDSR